MGPTIEGLDRLVKMPYGCGEQNMISTAPSIFVYKYLKAAGKLTEELKAKGENYMRIGRTETETSYYIFTIFHMTSFNFPKAFIYM
jgi:hypothetical protein